jgi:hypothetical protein
MPQNAMTPGLRIVHDPDLVKIESPDEGLCSSCADELPGEVLELLGNKRFETDSRPTLVRVVVRESMSVEDVEELADLIDGRLTWCSRGHEGFIEDPL